MIESIADLLRTEMRDAGDPEVFSRLLISSALEKELAGLDSRRLADFVREAFTGLAMKPKGAHVVRARRTDVLAGTGGPVRAGVIEILDDDMPYLVESVIAELNRRGLAPLLVFHPIFKTSRDGTGALREVSGPGDHDWASGDQESFISVVVGDDDDGALDAAVAGLDAVLIDVRHAATDADAMHVRLQQAIAAGRHATSRTESVQVLPGRAAFEEGADFLRWLEEGNFTILGMRDYDFVVVGGAVELRPSSAGGMGILRTPETAVLKSGSGAFVLTPEILAFYREPEPVFVTKSNAISRVRRQIHLDCVGVKRYSASGELAGELRIVGLFAQGAYLQSVEAIPIVRRKVARVIAEFGFPPDSHNGRSLISILQEFPRDELFQFDVEKLSEWALAIVDLQLRPRTRILTRLEQFDRFYTIFVFVPRDLYSTTNRERIGHYLSGALGGRVSAYFPYYTAGPLVRTRFIIGLGEGARRAVDEARFERDVLALLRTWEDRLQEAIGDTFGTDRKASIGAAYHAAFSAAYADTFDAMRAVEDILRIERLGPERPVGIDFYREGVAAESMVRAAVYRFDKPIPLSERVPVLENFGFRVIDERSYRVRPQMPSGARDVVLHDMMLETADGSAIDIAQHETRLEEAFLAVSTGLAENDLFNTMVIKAGLDWRQAALMRALGAYLRQARSPFGMSYMGSTLARHAAIARLLFDLIRVRFDPSRASDPDAGEATEAIRQEIETALSTVESLDEDRILRRFLNLAMAMVRTTFFRGRNEGARAELIAFKLDSHAVDALPDPKPYREIFVYSVRVEGIHLRFAKIARGGIRWSDRPQDYRTEVLGLAKAQQVKNTVIVASGAKGGFVAKAAPREGSRDAVQQAGISAYRTFIAALLSLTDNLHGNEVVPPRGVVRYEGDDPYLVVAADKGTATFSDYANAIAVEKGFWLGDAFASGGSSGYDHKRMGITARGAWECVRRHFRELELDVDAVPFRVIGVGDMSGDVFGNGMLRSREILLVAAFDHRDIFIDPTPDAAVSFAERERMFSLPRSSWADYDKSKISAGGGVFSRASKSIQVTKQMRGLLGIVADTMTPNELIRSILRARVDLLWFGGIGTFVRASSETDEQVNDRANDGIRIAASELGSRVIGEGANLGITQRGRIEAALGGIRLNADFIDNSAGVNTSDQEVNIKIALEPAVRDGRLDQAARNALLADMTEDVAAAVLNNNVQQSLALSLAERRGARDLAWQSRLVKHLEDRGLIERKLEALPSEAEFAERSEKGLGLTRPELAVILSWTKIALDADLLASDVPDEPGCQHLLLEYFPVAVREAYADEIAGHRLRREIIATRITNSMINRGGPAFAVRLSEETGRPISDIAHAFMA
ncbi:MAG: NAD-glutamate dehydrogenase, partial [Hyphomicrobiaceae bacterium]